ncbi:peptidase S8/S53 domain-containing protein [Phakopsora pachyrhizi]|uniref:Peptidase S8/S53 domain-containing protein n=1 Tax=Phakopsora pachyrhizi TaxID=170000 RepID=A0AAV0BPD7_PHAPC|nr:peptidase S8/S53 domain-containing protein [Phakopsora pachyrhizi]CAH7689164.1 peptidase S8/S53 domain-containing protein [Phakopsora pachyrhizi]
METYTHLSTKSHILFLALLSLIYLILGENVPGGGAYDQRYIVKIDPKKAGSLDSFCKELSKLGINHTVAQDYTGVLPNTFFGASIRLEDTKYAKDLAEIDGVDGITPVTIVKPIPPVSQTPQTKPLKTAKNPDSYAPLVQTRVSDLHAMGYYGQDMKIALIDSGVDCSHPALGGGFGPGYKISFGYDLVGDSFSGGAGRKPKNSPCTSCALHGTHTLGIVGAADVGFGFHGVAPNASLGMYLIGCDSESGTSNDIIISAILMAAKDGADVISASIGGIGGWSKGDALSDLVNNLFDMGVTLILAAGNEGNEGLFYAESPAAATNSLNIGSVESNTEKVSKLVTSTGKQIIYYSAAGFKGNALKVFPTSTTTSSPSDACEPLPDSTPNLVGQVALVRRGGCTFSLKAQHVAARGASMIIFYMNSTERATISSNLNGVITASVSQENGEWLFQQAKMDPGFSVSFPEGLHDFVATPRGGFVSNFSQYGPTYDFKNLAPAFLGVGGQIVSTIPVSMGSYSSMSGTSMATPQVAGIAALVKSIRGKNLSPSKLKSLLSTTAQQVFAVPKQSNIETVAHQGGGLVDAYCAAFAKSFLSVPFLSLADSTHFKNVKTFEITNEGTESITFYTSHIPADTVATFNTGSHRVSTTVQTVTGRSSAKVDVQPAQFTLGPGETQTITANFVPPTRIDPALLAVYSGYISLTSQSDCDSHTLPYFGVAGVMKEQKTIDHGPDTSGFSNMIQPRLTDHSRKPVEAGQVFTFERGATCNIRHRFSFGTRYSRIDVVPADAQLKPGPSPGEFIRTSVDFGKYLNLTQATFRGVKLVGLIADTNVTHTSRTAESDTVVDSWDGSVITPEGRNIEVPTGSYKLLLRALRVYGNPFNDYEYDTWLSPVVHVKRRSAMQRLASNLK